MKTSVLRLVVTLAGALVASAQLSARILNLSTRGSLAGGERQLVTGFVVAGAAAKQVLIRGIGPGLRDFGVSNAAGPVKVEVYDSSGAFVTGNDGHQTAPDPAALAQTATRVGAFALRDPGDSAFVAPFAPGGYTVVVSAAGDTASVGTALIEVYDADPAEAASTLINLSGRGMVGSADDALITGFVIGGEASHRLLVRGVGRELARWGIKNFAASVGLSIYSARGEIIATGASAAPSAAGDDTASIPGAFPMDGQGGAVVVVTLPPGAYTIAPAASAANASTDIALLEVYDGGPVNPAIEFPADLGK
jgi:hypothetical protein